MNTSLPEMLHYLNTPENFNRSGGLAKMSVLERQQTRIQEQLQQLPLEYFSTDAQLNAFPPPVQVRHFQDFSNDQNIGNLFTQAMKPDPGLDSGCTNFETPGKDSSSYGVLGNVTDFDMNYAVSRTTSCPPAIAVAMAEAAIAANKGKEIILPEKLNSSAGKESFKKRKADRNQNTKVTKEECKDKKLKGCQEEKDSKLREQKSISKNTANDSNNKKEPSDTTSKDNSKVSEVQKPDYIHVRARRGQATDSHSLAERVRREKISERMKFLQDLVPGCNKITGKAGMLDEIINYVQSLQRQVEFLSMKLAAVNPRLDFNIDNLFAKEIFPATTSEFHAIEVASDLNIPPTYPSDHLQLVSCCGLEMGTEPPNMLLRRTLSAPVSIPEVLIESPCFNHIQPCTWDTELQSLYGMEIQQARSSLHSQPCAGFIGGGDVKMEM